MAAKLRVFTCIDHHGYWPVGTASVVVAPDEATARKLLDAALVERRLKPDDYTLQELDTKKPAAIVLRDGDY